MKDIVEYDKTKAWFWRLFCKISMNFARNLPKQLLLGFRVVLCTKNCVEVDGVIKPKKSLENPKKPG